MKIAIDVNGVLRDTLDKTKQTYEKFLLIKNEEEEIQSFELSENSEEMLKENKEMSNFKYEITEPIDTYNIERHFKFKDKEEQFSFFYEEFPMQIFGHASSTEMATFNYFNEFYTNFRDSNDIYVVSDELGKSKPSTLFFLSKFGCLVENIIFYNTVTIDKTLSSFDLIVTSNPNIIINYSNNITVIKFETNYNKHVKADYTISTLKDLADTINTIQNVKIIQ
jgi:hypothetical protein